MNNVFIQIGFEDSPSTHYITHKTIYMYFLNNSHDLLKDKVLQQT